MVATMRVLSTKNIKTDLATKKQDIGKRMDILFCNRSIVQS